MAARRRPWGTSKDLVPIQLRVPEEIRALAHARAQELGISASEYVEQLLLADREQAIIQAPVMQEALDT